MIGLDGSGKTTVLYKLRLGETIEATSTVGFNVETVQISPKYSLIVWDIGGALQTRYIYSSGRLIRIFGYTVDIG